MNHASSRPKAEFTAHTPALGSKASGRRTSSTSSARSEAHDSGLCAAGAATWSEFASDLLNLTLASPSVNRHQKSANDVAEWLPDLNQCWYVDRTLQVRREYGLTIDRAEADAADTILAGCQSTDMVVLAPGTSATATPTPTTAATPTQSPDVDALALWDDNGNGRITCAEARGHGIAPVHRGHPGLPVHARRRRRRRGVRIERCRMGATF